MNDFLFLKDNWDMLSGITAGSAAAIGYLLNKRHELAWKRTEFLFEQSKHLDTNPVLVESTKILEGRHPSVSLDDLFPHPPSKISSDLQEKRHDFDRLLNFFHGLAYSVLVVRSLTVSETSLFGWYIQRICAHPGLRSYCETNGFETIVTLGCKAKLWYEGATLHDLVPSTASL
jgi:hypothetical protein